MKLIGIVGSTATASYNRQLLHYIQTHFSHLFELELLEIQDIPFFNQKNDQTFHPLVQKLNHRIIEADGVLISISKDKDALSTELKNALNWLSFHLHPFEKKPVMLIGAFLSASDAFHVQSHLKHVLSAPRFNAHVLPNDAFFLNQADQAFTSTGEIKDNCTVNRLTIRLKQFIRFISFVTETRPQKEKPLPKEDLAAIGHSSTTVEKVNKMDPNWVEKAAEKTKAATKKDYVQLNRGLLTVDQLNAFLCSMPMELTYVDNNNQFLYYNYTKEKKDMLAPRRAGQVGYPLMACHAAETLKSVEEVVQQLRFKKQECIRVPVCSPEGTFIVHHYRGIYDEKGTYMGVNEYVQDIQPTIDWYLKQTGQKLVKDHTIQKVPPISVHQENSIDGKTSASVHI